MWLLFQNGDPHGFRFSFAEIDTGDQFFLSLCA
jgi:hypothetical protein